MRTDPGLGLERVQDLPGLGVPGRFFEDGVSQSGNERNRLFSQLGTGAFRDVSGVSGLNSPADGRAFAWLDYDRDGWLDVATVNANAPLLAVHRNGLGELAPAGQGGALVVALEGGGRPGVAGAEWSNRDGIGARVRVTGVDGQTQVRELRAGEGLAAQNAGRLHFGLGAAAGAARVEVDWPSGRRSVVEDVPSGSLLGIGERGEVLRERWARGGPAQPEPTVANASPDRTLFPPDEPTDGSGDAPKLRVLTSFATWCGVCLGELPQVALLREAFDPRTVTLDGIPVDPEDTDEKLARWQRKHAPAYTVRSDWSPEKRAALATWLAGTLRSEGLPATVVTDARGRVLHTQWGVPTVSMLRALGAPPRQTAEPAPAS